MSHDEPFCPRQVTFYVGTGSPKVQVTATENEDGTITFVVDVQDTGATADLRGLFFHINEAKLPGLQVINADPLVTEWKVGLNNVIDMGQNASLNGFAPKFDVGIEFGTPGGKADLVHDPVTFTLDATANLTLDDIATMKFGARLDSIQGNGKTGGAVKLLGTAPYAPKAEDDSLSVFEDGAAGFNSPSKTPQAVTLNVLANDHDSDTPQANLSITSVHNGPSHGTVTIAADGKTVLYTPNLDYSGSDSFEYCITDGTGNQDSAFCNVDVKAVADLATIQYSIVQDINNVNKMYLNVVATQNDADSSEFVDDLTLSVAGGLPAGASIVPGGVDPAGEPDFISKQFVITLAPDSDYNFNIDMTATSKETGNGDTQDAVATQKIEIDFNHNEEQRTFITQDQSLWNTGEEIVYDETTFLGIDTPFGGDFTVILSPLPPAWVDVEGSGHLKTGFDAHVTFNAGGIDITLDMLITIDTTYNKTTDTLFIEPSAVVQGGSFTTTGPEGSFSLDFVFDYALDFSIAFEPLGDYINYNESVGDSFVEPIFSISSTDPSLPLSFTLWPGALTGQVDWPHLSDSSDPGTLESSISSNNMLELTLDADFALLPGVLDQEPLNPDNFEWLDVDLTGALNLLQDIIVDVVGMQATNLVLEDGESIPLSFGTPIMLNNVASHDTGDAGDTVGFSLSMAPNATLHNETSIGVNLGVDVAVLKNIPVIGGNLWDDHIDIPITDIEVFNDTFAINGFQSQSFNFVV